MAAAVVYKPKIKPKDTDSLFWTKSASGKMGTHVPGVTVRDKGNLRPKVKGGRVKEVKAAVPLVQPEAEEEGDNREEDQHEDFLDSKTATSVAASEVTQSILDTEASTITTLRDSRKVSLRDLCVEDKKRVANLIKELAKLGEEKESAEKNLEEERRRYEEQILQLVDQQEEILREREEVQKRMLEYQTYILSLRQRQKEAELREVQRAASKAKIPLTAERKPNLAENKEIQQCSRTGDRNVISEEISNEEDNHGDNEVVDQPSKHFYLNDLDEEEIVHNGSIDRTATRFDNLSTQVQPALSPQPIPLSHSRRDQKHMNLNVGQSPRPDRPFTTFIDKELENQKRALEVAMKNHSNRPMPVVGGRSVQALLQTPVDDNREVCIAPDSQGPGEQQSKINTADKFMSYLPKTEAERFISLPHGNLSLLTPEKNELLSRFMESHSELRHLAGQSKYQQISEAPRHHKNSGNCENGEQTRVRSGDCHDNQLVENNQENIVPERDAGTQKAAGVVASHQFHSTGKSNHHHHHHHHGRKKQRRPPPPSYGPLHPPVMSSTQKSSEIADFVSVTSTEVSLPDQCRDQKLPPASSPNDRGKSHGKNQRVVSGSKGQQVKEKDGKFPGRAVEFSEKPHDAEAALVLPQEEDFLEKYRKMSPSERKRELLKQKSMLLEEQARLKMMLSDQETQLQQKQQEAMNKMEKFQEMRAADDVEAGKMQESLVRLEAELARKEQELIQGRALLRQKKQAQVELQARADDAFLEDTSPSKAEVRSDVLSSTPLKDIPNILSVSSDGGHEANQLVSNEKPSVSVSPSSSPKAEKKLSGRDGDSCTLYVNSLSSRAGGDTGDGDAVDAGSTRRGASEVVAAAEPGIVRKLDFTPDSDTKPDGLANKKSQEIKQNLNSKAVNARENNENKVDVGTSISYANLS
ncbi:protein hinderin, partial [Elysia marginata]